MAKTFSEQTAPTGDSIDQTPAFNDQLMKARLAWPWRLIGGALIIIVLLAISFEFSYAGKIYPGVTADGILISGLSRSEAKARLSDKIADFSGHAIAITYGDTTVRLPINSLDVQYDTDRSLDLAYSYGRTGGFWQRVREQARAVFGRSTEYSSFTYDDNKLTPYFSDITDDVSSPVTNAGLTFNDEQAQVTPAEQGKRLNIGRLVNLVEDRLARTDITPVAAPIYNLPAAIGTDAVQRVAGQASTYVAGPIELSYGDLTKEIDRGTITGWIKVGYRPPRNFLVTHDLTDLYPGPSIATISLDRAAINTYIAGLASKVDRAPQNAALTMNDGHLDVAQPSQTGVKLDQTAAGDAIIATLAKPADQRNLTLNLQVTHPDVTEDKLDSLGIKEQISEGVTYFPGSSKARLTNVRVGASKFNGVLLKPGEIFSFGALLGDVGPEQGYEPELVILANHEEKQYGGGLCQVSSTAFRAALNAGLPIVERHNHSFAVSYYTAPFNAPGVDATIYYPQLDFKFKNDTPGYILIQTTMEGTTLKFDFFGTKTKSGVIRGPEFISGSNDPTKPSHTVFYRDILDLSGKVIKTDAFNTYYQSSLDYPVQTTNGYN